MKEPSPEGLFKTCLEFANPFSHKHFVRAAPSLRIELIKEIIPLEEFSSRESQPAIMKMSGKWESEYLNKNITDKANKRMRI